MGGITGGDYVRRSGISQEEFVSQLEANGITGDRKTKALSIFNQYADSNNADDGAHILNEVEQIAARDAFAKIAGDDGEVTKKEYNLNKQDQNLDDYTYKAYKAFIGVLNDITENAGDKDVAVTTDTDNSDCASVKDADSKDPTVTIYNYGEEQAAEPPKPEADPNFASEASVQKVIYEYLLNVDDLEKAGIKIEDLNNLNALDGLEIVTETLGSNNVQIKFGGATYILHRTKDGYSIDNKDNKTTLQQAILDSDTSDKVHEYRNRYGKAGNTKSNYNADTGVIENESNRKQHVNPVQTFTSMLLNNTEKSTLQIDDKNFDGQEIINVISGQNNADGITLNQLIKYINASVQESQAAEEFLKNDSRGTRTAAGDVDLDLKDITNLGIIFKQFDKTDDGKLDKDELNALIKALTTKDITMTSMAKTSEHKHQYNEPDALAADTQAQQGTQQQQETQSKTHYGAIVSGPDRTRHLAGTDKAQDVNYIMDGNRRILVEQVGNQWRTVENVNIAEVEDHGIMGAGRKDFIRINGLSSNVRAEVISGDINTGKGLTIKVKDANGDTKYYQVTKNGNGTYTLGNEVNKAGHLVNSATKILSSLKMQDNLKVPQDLAVKKKGSKTVYMIKGREVKQDVARAYVIAYNVEPAEIKHINKPQKQNS